MLGADWLSIRTCPLTAVAFRCLGAVVDRGFFAHFYVVECEVLSSGGWWLGGLLAGVAGDS